VALFAVTELLQARPKSLRFRRFLAYSAVVIALLLGIWPILATVILFTRREYLLGSLPLLYAFPYCVCIALAVWPTIRFVKFYRKNGMDAAVARAELWREQIQRKAPTDEQYEGVQEAIWRFSSKIMTNVSLVFVLPTVSLKIALGTLGAPVGWWPDFEPAFFVLFTLMSYFVARTNHLVVALTISGYLYLLKLYDVVSNFETHGGTLRILSHKKHQSRLSRIIFPALIMTACGGCVHYCISLLNPAAYSKSLSAIDGLYFSVTTFATVGYGDIYPRADLAKLVCVGEIISGCLVLVFGVNLAMTVWVQKFADAKSHSAVPLPAAKQTPAEPAATSGNARAE
jgi:hypothetical protein